jgi:hypothetical protein
VYRLLFESVLDAPDQHGGGPVRTTRLRGVKLRLAPLFGHGYLARPTVRAAAATLCPCSVLEKLGG